MHIIIFYFSGTGNTKWTSDRIATVLTANSAEAQSVSIEALHKAEVDKLVKKADMIGLAYPIYGSDIPEPMKAFIDALPEQPEGKPAIVFCTQMMFSGDGAFVCRKTLKEKGYTIAYSAHFNLPNNISMFSWLPVYGEKHHARCLTRAGRRIDAFARHIAVGKKHLHLRMGYLFGVMQRAPFRATMAKNGKWLNMLGVDKARCISCERCARICPVNNIIMRDKSPEWQGHCALCTRCYNFCPTAAITYNGKTHEIKRPLYKGPDKAFKPEQLKVR